MAPETAVTTQRLFKYMQALALTGPGNEAIQVQAKVFLSITVVFFASKWTCNQPGRMKKLVGEVTFVVFAGEL